MRIVRLDLLAFGPFTGHTLQFDPARPALHIVVGPNEAGKSSSLRALRQWLYGIPHASSDNFLHAHGDLRIGGVLEDAAGNRLEFIRRKGRVKTLRGPDDVEVADEFELQRMLGGLTEDVFCQRFGIGCQELRDGGRAIIEEGGELGSILFAAGTGIADISKLQTDLDEQLQALFKPAGSRPRINEALANIKQLRDEVRNAQLPTARWVEHNQALAAARQRLDETTRQLGEKKARRKRLEGIEKALPLLQRQKQVAGQLAAVASAALLPADFSAQRRERISSLEHALQTEQEADRQLAWLEAAMAEVTVPAGLLEHRSTISRLHTDLGSHLKAARDRPSRVAEREQIEKRARKALQDIGREPDLRLVGSLLLTRVQRQRIQDLAAEYQARSEKHASAAAELSKLQKDLQSAEAAFTQCPEPPDARELDLAVRRTRKQGDLDQQLASARATLQKLANDAAVGLSRLPLFNGTLEELERLPVCSEETVERFRHDQDRRQAGVEAIEKRIEELSGRLARLGSELESLRLEHDVPTEADLTEARRQRDEQWQSLRTLLQQPPAAKPAADVDTLADAYQASVEAVDRLADRLRHEADRVARKAQLTADRRESEQQLDREQQKLAEARGQVEQLLQQWREQWTAAGIVPSTPREMQAWLRQQKELVELAARLREQTTLSSELETRIAALRADLVDQLERLDQPLPASAVHLSDVLEWCEQRLAAIALQVQQRQDGERRLADLGTRLPAAEMLAAQSAQSLEQWKADWAEAISPLGLPATATTTEARAVMEAVEELVAELKEMDNLQLRIDGIDRDAEEFTRNVKALLESIAPDLLTVPVDRAIADLHDRLEQATAAQTKLDGWKEQVEAERSRKDQSHATVEQLQARLQAMCATAGCTSIEELPVAEQRSDERRQAEQALAAIREQLVNLAGSDPLEEFLATAEAMDAEQVGVELQQLAIEIDELEAERSRLSEAIGAHRTELSHMDGNSNAADAQARLEERLASLRNDAEQYIRLRLAASVLRRSIERFREASQGPVIARAGELFAELTLGSFATLRADYDDQGKATLAGVRASDSRTVPVTAMSDGTCDQMYLALRLALLESYLAENEPVPFVVDDILVQFDDQRAAATLAVLEALSHKTQIILFTHHEHLVELARNHLGTGTHQIHRLNSQAPAVTTASNGKPQPAAARNL